MRATILPSVSNILEAQLLVLAPLIRAFGHRNE